MSTFRLVVLASGSGTLFQALIDHQEIHNGQLVGLITDVNCPAIQRADLVNIPHSVIEVGNDRNLWDEKLSNKLSELNPDLIISAGFMRIIGPKVLEKFEGKIINTHPALLPNFPGAHAVRDALVAGATKTGSTIHFVDAGMDTGSVISQQEIFIEPGESETKLHDRIKEVERKLLVQVVAEFVSGKIKTRQKG